MCEWEHPGRENKKNNHRNDSSPVNLLWLMTEKDKLRWLYSLKKNATLAICSILCGGRVENHNKCSNLIRCFVFNVSLYQLVCSFRKKVGFGKWKNVMIVISKFQCQTSNCNLACIHIQKKKLGLFNKIMFCLLSTSSSALSTNYKL